MAKQDVMRKNKTVADIDSGSNSVDQPIQGEGIISSGVYANPLKQYAAAPGALMFGSFIISKPVYVDDLTRDFGTDLYDRMMYDPQVYALVNDLRASIFENGIEIKAVNDLKNDKLPQVRIGKPKAQSSDKAVEIAEFCKYNIENLDRPFLDTMYEMSSALYYGNKAAEKIYEVDKSEYKGKLVLKALKTVYREHISFVTDNYNNIVACMLWIPGVAYPISPQSILADPAKLPNCLPKEKFAILSHLPQNGDPRGTSILRSAYNAWWMKQQLWYEIQKWAVKSAGSSIVGTLPEKALPVQLYDESGNPIGAPIQPADAMLAALQNAQNGSVTVMPYGTEIMPLPVNDHSGEQFDMLIDKYNSEIAKAILGQTLATEEGKHQSRAAASTHADTMAQIKIQKREWMCDFIRREILRPLVLLNYPGCEHLIPIVTGASTDADDFAADASALASLGYQVDESQYTAIDEMLGLPTRADNWQEQKIKTAQALMPNKGVEPVKPEKDNVDKTAKFSDEDPQVVEEQKRMWSFWRSKKG